MSNFLTRINILMIIGGSLLILTAFIFPGAGNGGPGHSPANLQIRHVKLGASISGTTSNAGLHLRSPALLRFTPNQFKNIGGKRNAAIGRHFKLLQNYPNPFNPETRISFNVPESNQRIQAITLTIYNLAGQQVRRLFQGEVAAGAHSYIWDGRNESGTALSSGLYVYVLRGAGFSSSRKMLLLK